MPKKSGQTALILVIVTMVTVLGIGVASSTQSNINLRNTVYSTQSEQSLSCAEAGAEKAVGLITSLDPGGNGLTPANISTVNDVSNSEGGLPESNPNCTYNYSVAEYPAGGSGEVKIPKLQENTVQELRYTGNGPSLTVQVTPLSNASKSSVAIYVYSAGVPSLQRSFYFVGTDSANRPEGFNDVSGAGPRTINLPVGPNTRYIRIRPLYSDISVTIPNFQGQTGFFIQSTGKAGIVERVVEAYRFLSQLPAAFDEAVVMLDDN